MISRAGVAALGLVGLLCACNRQPRGACDSSKIEALVTRLDAANPHDRPDLLHEQLGQACELPDWAQSYLGHLAPVGTKLPRHDERSRPLTLDHDAFGRACAAGKQVVQDYLDLPGEQRAASTYERCDLARYGLGTVDDAIPWMIWALHHWLLEQGLAAEQARTISRAALLSDNRAYAPAGTYADRTLPVIAELEPARRFGLVFVHVTASAIIFDNRELASIVDGRIEDIALDRDEILPALLLRIDDKREQSVSLFEARGEPWPAQLDIAADRRTPVQTIMRLTRTGSRAGYRAFSLVVETAPFEHAPVLFELARPDVEPELRVTVEQPLGACADAGPGATVEIVARESTSVGELADALAVVWRQQCVGRVLVSVG